jgi:hypothetical protein
MKASYIPTKALVIIVEGYTFDRLRQLQRECPLGLPSSGDYRPHTFSKLIHNSKGIENICDIEVLFIGGQVIMNV